MNKHAKLVVGFLVVVLVVLVIATISFSVDISKNSEASQSSGSDTVINPNGNEIIQYENHLYGVADAAGNTLIEPEWEQLHFIGTEYLAAAKETAEGRRIGVLDLDGNVVAPFVYTDVHALTPSYYLASFADSEQVVLYDSGFRPVDAAVWDSYSWESQLLTLTKGEDVFLFTLEDDALILTRADIVRTSEEVSFTVSWNGVDAALLSPVQWSKTADQMLLLLQMLKSQEFVNISQITDQEHENTVLSTISLGGHKVTRMEDIVYLSADTGEDGKLALTWQCRIGIWGQEDGVKEQILSVTMKQNKQEVWVITEMQIA
ncbi:WG repeat-containing protein [Ruminococcus sp.]|uniref:WG repeat-containing protein n=1 Tax=Ruminococcus sp. TaxID=41978 RepID=UPI0025FE310D|nr:WG repeat-containing protein [Ruminococcus sp.]